MHPTVRTTSLVKFDIREIDFTKAYNLVEVTSIVVLEGEVVEVEDGAVGADEVVAVDAGGGGDQDVAGAAVGGFVVEAQR